MSALAPTITTPKFRTLAWLMPAAYAVHIAEEYSSGFAGAFDRASPGLFSATLLYFPLSILVGRALLREGLLGRGAFAGAVALGAGLMGFVIWYGLFHFAV